MGIQLVLISGFLHGLAIIIISDKAQVFARTVMGKDRLQKKLPYLLLFLILFCNKNSIISPLYTENQL